MGSQSWTRLRDKTELRRVWQLLLANTLQDSCLENPFLDREAWKPAVHRVAKSQTLRKRPSVHRRKTFFACFSSALVRVEHEGGTAAWLAGTLAVLSVQGHGLFPLQELWPYQSLFLSLLVAGDQKTSLAGLSQ